MSGVPAITSVPDSTARASHAGRPNSLSQIAVMTPLVSADADFTANQGSNSLILTDTCANIRRIVKIISKLDQHEATASDIRIVQLVFANATSAAR